MPARVGQMAASLIAIYSTVRLVEKPKSQADCTPVKSGLRGAKGSSGVTPVLYRYIYVLYDYVRSLKQTWQPTLISFNGVRHPPIRQNRPKMTVFGQKSP